MRKTLGGWLVRLGQRIARPTITDASEEIFILAGGGGGGGATFQSFPVAKLPREADGTIKPLRITVGKGGQGGSSDGQVCY
ncbi:hypothetical protein [Nocardia nova]|uniref:hypothetical protein n=1 Tax=Nocardia nova TaxID=37330 RepID=UPI002739B259|nr:hypothetical protein [Nocardia nova]